MKNKLLKSLGITFIVLAVVAGVAYAMTLGGVDGVWGYAEDIAESPETIIDMLGTTGSLLPTSDQRRVRLASICVGDPDGTTDYNSQWTSTASAVWTGLGSHTSTCSPASSLILSEYVRDYRTNYTNDDRIGLEIYNGTGSAVDLSQYTIRFYTSSTAYTSVALNSVSLANNDVFVLVNTNAADSTTQEDQTFSNNDAYRTVALVRETVEGAVCTNYATGPVSASTDYDTPTSQDAWLPSVQGALGGTDWNQIRYGSSSSSGCSSSCLDFGVQSGFGFDGVDDVSPDPEYPYTNQPFYLGKFCHFNNPITASACGDWARLYYVDLDVQVGGIKCADGSDPTPNNAIEFPIRFNLDETPNSEPCAYNPPGTTVCADAVTVGQMPAADSFTCTVDQATVTYYIQILGFIPAVGGDCADTYDPTKISSQYISDEGADRCACLWARVVDYVPTAVDLISFTAEGSSEGILLEWETTSEVDNVGFNIYRGLSEYDAYTRINLDLIPSDVAGSPSGASYSFLDQNTQGGVTYYYWLENIDTEGIRSTLQGPITATSGAPIWKMFLPVISSSGYEGSQ